MKIPNDATAAVSRRLGPRSRRFMFSSQMLAPYVVAGLLSGLYSAALFREQGRITLGIHPNDLGELLRSRRDEVRALRVEARLHVGALQSGGDVLADLVDNPLWGAGRSHEAEPGIVGEL